MWGGVDRFAAPVSARFPAGLAGGAGATVAGSWDRLAAMTASWSQVFDPRLVAGLPLPARRWLVHAIAPGTRLSRTVVLEMEGRFRLGRWLPMWAKQVLSPPSGLVWVARIGWGPLSFRGFDRYETGHGEMQWRLLGGLPVAHSHGADIDRSDAKCAVCLQVAAVVCRAYCGTG